MQVSMPFESCLEAYSSGEEIDSYTEQEDASVE